MNQIKFKIKVLPSIKTTGLEKMAATYSSTVTQYHRRYKA